jgi:hypothetical protein
MLARARVAQFGAHYDARVDIYDRKMFIIQTTGHIFVSKTHRHLSNIDCLMACTACLVCFFVIFNG